MINNRFIIKKKLGEGRSKVYLCSDNENPGKDFAIKILNESADAHEIKIFRNEFFTLQNLNHPNIISSFDEGTILKTDNDEEIIPGRRFIVLEYFPGTELLNYNLLNDEKKLNIILKQICTVLYYLHQSNYIYYDLKPENILVNERDGTPFIKLIDMGFAQHIFSSDEYVSRGTKEYIAPEILKKENHNHQVDLYSLGIMLYRIIYGKFPFHSDTELEIYKEQIEREFDFPESIFSSEIIEVVKKLLEKNPLNRFDNSLQILKSINFDIEKEDTKYFVPANLFADRERILTEINNYLNENINKEALIISGAEGSGKTSLAYEIYSGCDNIILVNPARWSGSDFIGHLLKKIVFSDFIYNHLNKEIIEGIYSIISGTFENLNERLKALFIKISANVKFTIIIDDLSSLDEFAMDILRELIPVLQVNDINIIITERNDSSAVSERIINISRTINLTPFTEKDLDIYLDEALATFFPKDQLKKLIIKYADLLPGSIINFIRDLIFLNVIRFGYEGSEIAVDQKSEKLLHSSHEEIFRIRFSLLTNDEIKIAQFLSAFGSTGTLPDKNIIAALNNLTVDKFDEILKNLEEKSILQVSNIENIISFTSDSLRNFIYSTIDDKENYHLKIADSIPGVIKNYNRNELARHYEKGKDFISSYKILSEEIDEAEKLSAYSYKKNLINHLLQLPLPPNYEIGLKRLLSNTLYKLNDAMSALNIIEELLTKTEDKKDKNELLILKGSCLIELGEYEEGKNIITSLLDNITDDVRKQKLMVEIAYAEFDLNRYETAMNLCQQIINNINSSDEEKGKCYNLLGLIDTYKNNKFIDALNNFKNGLEIFHTANLILNEAKIEVNIGNTYNRIEDYINAEKYWSNALQRNQSLGNLDQEAKILLNFGIFYFNKADFKKAIEHYKRAYSIFTSLGNRSGQNLVLTNLGETYISLSDYQGALDSLIKAFNMVRQLTDIEEKAELIFLRIKLFFCLGDKKQINDNLSVFKELIDNNHLPEKYINNYKYWEAIHTIHEEKTAINSNNLKSIIDSFKEQNEGGFFAEGFLILSEILIKSGMLENAYSLLNDEKLSKICDKNFLYHAHKKYLLSMLSKKNNFMLPPAIELLEEAEYLIKDEQITELTWKVLFSLGENYFQRGNLKKANEYFLYSKEIINYIAKNIKDDNLRSHFLSKPERRSVFEQIEIIQKN